MSGETDLTRLLATMNPELDVGEYVFVTLPGAVDLVLLAGVTVMAVVAEAEGTTVVLPRSEAEQRGWAYDFVAARITLLVHSSLVAVGLTAAFATELGRHSISCNVVSGYFHDHIYVPIERACDAMRALEALRDANAPSG